jgi:hypothetical protein
VTVVAKALAPKILLRQFQVLNLGTHRAVEHKDALGRELVQRFLDLDAVRRIYVAHMVTVIPGLPGTHDRGAAWE